MRLDFSVLSRPQKSGGHGGLVGPPVFTPLSAVPRLSPGAPKMGDKPVSPEAGKESCPLSSPDCPPAENASKASNDAVVPHVPRVPPENRQGGADPSRTIPLHSPAAWKEDFDRWLDSACACSPRCFGGVNCLHIAFCESVVGQGGVPCTRDTFERQLAERGFLIGEVCGVLLVSGLTFREDFEVYR
jgi:hypothetical protein